MGWTRGPGSRPLGSAGHCVQRGWSLLAAHVRTNHVHAIVEAGVLIRKARPDLQQALQYVVKEQGKPLALFIAETL
jgi:hypothetical protein